MLGSLAEKQVTTPDYYPLTMNALVHACNQISNRDPVVQYDERQVAEAVDSLRQRNVVYIFYGAESRVPKYKHMLREVLGLSPPELAALCVLMLRGPQTVGELRINCDRLHRFADTSAVEAFLHELAAREAGALVVLLPRQPGAREARWAHLLAGAPSISSVPQPLASENDRGTDMNAEIAALKADVAQLREQVASLTAAIAQLHTERGAPGP